MWLEAEKARNFNAVVWVLGEVNGYLDEVAETYKAQDGSGSPPTVEPRRPYRDYIGWLIDQDVIAAKRFWRETLSGFSAPTPIVRTLPKSVCPVDGADEFGSRRRQLSLDVTARLQAV